MAMGDVNLELCLETGVAVARSGAEIVRTGYEKMKTIQSDIKMKANPIDLVTEFDKKVEEFLFGELGKKFPNHSFIGEESVSDGNAVNLTDNPTWVIDPIDGTMNFVHRLPNSAICIALMVNKQVMIGIVYHVAHDLMYTAQKGKGSFCNGERLHVSPRTELSQSLVIMELGSNREENAVNTILQNLKATQMAAHGVRMLGSCALNMCQVARGGADAYVEFGVHIWDYAASAIIVQEAGGVVTDPSGGPVDFLARRLLCASTSNVAHSLGKIIKPIEFERDGP